jgi:hypothetical protein
MKTICVYTDCPLASFIHHRLDELADRIPCIARFFSSTGEIFIECRVEDAAFAESMIADLV